MKNELFYTDGLEFSCKRCSACCRYDAGYVFLTEPDLKKLVHFMGMEREVFIGVYCRWVEGILSGVFNLSLKEKPGKDCIFWDNGCTVYAARPIQCVNFPFWESIVSSQEAWNMAASGCPGMNHGDIFTKEAIEDLIKKSKQQPLISRKKKGANI